MYDETYEEYIRSILGYPSQVNNMSMSANIGIENTSYGEYNNYNRELNDCYPEIYRIVYPMITKACGNNMRPINRDLVDEMTEEIFSAVEENREINVNINLQNQIHEENRGATTIKKEPKPPIKQENRGERENRQIRNNSLRDLIRILIIRELLGRPQFPGNRPGMPGPGGPPPRPPFRPRIYDNLYEY